MSALDNMSFFTPLDEGEQLSLGANQLAPGLGNTSSTQATEGSFSTVKAKKPRKKLLTTQLKGLLIGGLANTTLNTMDSMIQNPAYNTTNGGYTLAGDLIYNSVTDVVGLINPVAGTIMKGAGVASKLIMNATGATDGETKVDALMNSVPMLLLGVGIVNNLGAKRAESLSKDKATFSEVGADFTGLSHDIDELMQKAGKSFGSFSRGKLADIDERTRLLKRAQMIAGDVASTSRDLREIAANTLAQMLKNREIALQGGFKYNTVLTGKKGTKLNSPDEDEAFNYYLSTLPEYLRDSTHFRVRDFWKLNGMPKDFLEAITKKMFTEKNDGWHANSVAYNKDTDEYEFMKSPDHPFINKEIEAYNSKDMEDFRKEFELIKSLPYWKYVRRSPNPSKKEEGGLIELINPYIENNDIPEFKEGGNIINEDSLLNPEDFTLYFLEEVDIPYIIPESLLPEFKEGGAVNVIPEGALHARKHDLDIEGITSKGIPVIDDENNLHAEIEKEEIIFRLDVTKELEELYKIFYNEESSEKEKDECALKAGELLVYEILHNTLDNTNNLL